MSRILGASCSPQQAYLALVADGTVQATPDRLEWPIGEESERLGVLLDDVANLLREEKVERVAILLPERGPRVKWRYSTLAPRLALETVIRLAAVRGKLPVDIVERNTVRARLDFSGQLEKRLDVVPGPVGRYWRQGRGLAAMAAFAAGKR